MVFIKTIKGGAIRLTVCHVSIGKQKTIVNCILASKYGHFIKPTDDENSEIHARKAFKQCRRKERHMLVYISDLTWQLPRDYVGILAPQLPLKN